MSDRTRSKTKKKKKVDASRYDNRSGATAAGSPGADETVRLNVGMYVCKRSIYKAHTCRQLGKSNYA